MQYRSMALTARHRHRRFAAFTLLTSCMCSAYAEIYSYTNEDGDYIVSQTRPEDRKISYAVLSDDGEFIRMVEGRDKQVPITHWRPFYLPKEPHPMDGPDVRFEEPEPVINIDEVETVED